MNCDYALENRLRKEDAALSLRYTQCMPTFDMMLRKFFGRFPTFTDHTLLHSLSVINLSNYLMQDHVQELNADEIYVYLLASGLHDVGMGVTDKDFEEFMAELGKLDLPENQDKPRPVLIRNYHNELSGKFVMKYYEVLDIPNEKYAFVVAEVCRGHRKTDLFNEEEFPTHYEVEEGRFVNTARLGALLRLADELDCASDRNPDLLFDLDKFETPNKESLLEFNRHKAVKSVTFEEDALVAHVHTDDPVMKEACIKCIDEVREKLNYCLDVMNARGGNLLCYDKIEISWE